MPTFTSFDINKVPLWIAIAALFWTYCAALVGIGISFWPQIEHFLDYWRSGYPASLDLKKEREVAALLLFQDIDAEEAAEFEQRLLLEVEVCKYLTEGLTVIVAALSASLATSIAIADKKLAMTPLLTSLQPYLAILLVIAIFTILMLTGDRQVYRRLACVAHKASGQSFLVKDPPSNPNA